MFGGIPLVGNTHNWVKPTKDDVKGSLHNEADRERVLLWCHFINKQSLIILHKHQYNFITFFPALLRVKLLTREYANHFSGNTSH